MSIKEIMEHIFQSMHPIKDATESFYVCRMCGGISIHAPYKGCNFAILVLSASGQLFQSMHPIKDATYSDLIIWTVMEFQSMHPIKDATLFHFSDVAVIYDFNPCTL